MSEDSNTWSPPTSLVEFMKSISAPGLTEVSLNSRFGPRSGWTLNPGQIWRVRSESINVLALIARVGDLPWVNATPVSIEPTGEDEQSAVTIRGDESFTSPMTVWKALTCELPTRYLDRPVADLGIEITHWVMDDAPLPSNFRIGSKPSLGGDLEIRSRIEDEFAEICENSNWQESTVRADEKPIKNIESEDLDKLSSLLGLSMPTVLEIVDGQTQLSTEQAQVVRDVLGGLPRKIAIPTELVAEIDHPSTLNIVKKISERERLSDASARAFIANSLLGLAARQTGRSAIAWRERLNQWAEVHQVSRNP